MTRSVEQMQKYYRGVSDEELAGLIDTVRRYPAAPPPPARMGMFQGPTRGKSSLVLEVMVRKLREKWGRMR